jgi:hypothetical protein
MCAERSDHIVDGETCCVGIREYACDEGAKATFMLARRVGLGRRGADERSDAALRFDHARPLKFRVDARDRVGIDLEINGQLTNCRQLVAWT